MENNDRLTKPCIKCGLIDRFQSGACRSCARARAHARKMSSCSRCGSSDRNTHGVCRPCDRRYKLSIVNTPCLICGSADRYVNGRCRLCSKKSRIVNWEKQLLNQAKSCARRRGHPAPTITITWIKEQYAQSSKCPYTGIELIPPSDEGSMPWQPSLDRIDNSLSYTPENTRLTSWFWNSFRNTLPIEIALRNLRTTARAILSAEGLKHEQED